MAIVDVAIACCRRTDDSPPSDLYPDPDADPLRRALGDLGASSTLVAWDDPGADWRSFGCVVVSSTWDSVDRPHEYLAWANAVPTMSVLINPAPVIEWALDKKHQRDLADLGVPVIPTTWVEPGDLWEPPTCAEIVVKPSISAGGRDTARYACTDVRNAQRHVGALQALGRTVMVQEYLGAIDTDGELDLIYVDGEFSHAVQKLPALALGSGVVERPWERMAWAGLATPDHQQLAVADHTMTVVSERLQQRPTYGRVDLVNDAAANPVVLEIELIDPYLSLDMEPEGASRLAASILGGSNLRPPGRSGPR